jgi:hypothetical protein
LQDVEGIINSALAFWYTGISGKTGLTVVRRAKLFGVVKQFEDKDFVWGQSYSESAKGQEEKEAERDEKERLRLERVEKLREGAKKSSEKKAKAVAVAAEAAEEKKKKKEKKKEKKEKKQAKAKADADLADVADGEEQDVVVSVLDVCVRQKDKDGVASMLEEEKQSIRAAELASVGGDDADAVRPQEEEFAELAEQQQQSKHKQQNVPQSSSAPAQLPPSSHLSQPSPPQPSPPQPSPSCLPRPILPRPSPPCPSLTRAEANAAKKSSRARSSLRHPHDPSACAPRHQTQTIAYP